jgi:hypothetical protein
MVAMELQSSLYILDPFRRANDLAFGTAVLAVQPSN